MGATDVKSNKQQAGQADGNETTDGVSRTESTAASETRQRRRTRTNPVTKSESGEAEQTQESPRLVDLVLPDGEVKKPKRQYKKKKQDTTYSFDAEQVKILLLTISSIVGSRENFEQWQLSELEAESIAIPLMNLAKKSDVFSKITEKSDAIALVVALSTVMVPRVMVTVDKMKKGKDNNGNRIIRKTTKTANSNTVSKEQDSASASTEYGNGSLVSSIPSIAEAF